MEILSESGTESAKKEIADSKPVSLNYIIAGCYSSDDLIKNSLFNYA